MIFFTILAAIYFMLPAYAANALPVISAHFKIFPKLAFPIDNGIKYKNKELFGHSKTFRGFVVGISGALIIGIIQYFLFNIEFFRTISLFDYSLVNVIPISFLLGFGALLGDLIKSFLKRRIGIKSGSPWIIADQVDYVIGALLLTSLLYIPPFIVIIILLILSPLFALLANIFAFFTGMKKVWW